MHPPEVFFGSQGGIPVVDFRPFLDGTHKVRVSQAIADAFENVGFVYLINHGLEDEKIQSMFSWSKKFFDLPMETKMLAPHPDSGTHHRGYSAPGRERIVQDLDSSKSDGATPIDVKESFEVGREDGELPNIWLPSGILPGFSDYSLEFFWACRSLQLDILRALALGFSLPEDYFMQFHTQSDNQLRLLHYPSVPASLLNETDVHRIVPHSDFDTFTLLFQDEIGGLEVEDPSHPGVFRPAPPVPGSVVVNVGDFLMRWSNDMFRSTIHRVRVPPGKEHPDGSMIPERYSIPYFCSLDLDAVVDCLPGTYSSENPKRYEPISAREYINKRLAANY